jgi:hypothetical protein
MEELVGRITGRIRTRDTLQRVAEELRQRHDAGIARRRPRRPNGTGRDDRRGASAGTGLSASP